METEESAGRICKDARGMYQRTQKFGVSLFSVVHELI